MRTYDYVKSQLSKMQGLSKSEIIVRLAELCMGWSYVWGAAGSSCTPANRTSFASRDVCPAAEARVIISKCQNLNGGKSCETCKWYPGGRTLFFDCRGFTRWLLKQVGIDLKGAGATSQWNTKANWVEYGDIKNMPRDKVCCVFMREGDKMSHTGMYCGNGKIIHCSGEVKEDTPANTHWTHYAIPAGLDGTIVVDKPTLRKGATGEYVVECQQRLIELGYDLSPYGADGKYGNKTVSAVKAFQKDHGLTADGVVGRSTWSALGQPNKQPIQTYSVTISLLTKQEAEELCAKYSNAKMSAD